MIKVNSQTGYVGPAMEDEEYAIFYSIIDEIDNELGILYIFSEKYPYKDAMLPKNWVLV